MRKLIITAIAAFTAFAGIDTADAQVRIGPGIADFNGSAIIMVQKQPRLRRAKPGMLIISPSEALKMAQRAMPAGAKALGVRLRGNVYVVRFKKGGTVSQVIVDSATGTILSAQ